MLKHRQTTTSAASSSPATTTTTGAGIPSSSSSRMSNLTAGKSKIHLLCIGILVSILILRFFILPFPFGSSSNSATSGDLSTNPILSKRSSPQQIAKLQNIAATKKNQQSQNNNKITSHNDDDDEYEEFELPPWVVNDLPSSTSPKKQTSSLSSLNEKPPQYPKETNNDQDAKKAVEEVIKRTLAVAGGEKNGEEIAQNFLKVTTIEVLEEEESNHHVSKTSWCTSSQNSNSKVPECFKLEWFSSNSKDDNSLMHLRLTGTTRIMTTKGFYHILKHFLVHQQANLFISVVFQAKYKHN